MFNHTDEKQGLTIDETTKAHMLEIARWGKFMAISGYVLMALLVLFGIVVAISLSSLADGFGGKGGVSPTLIPIIMCLLAALYFYPVYSLYKYAVKIKTAIATEDQVLMNMALGYLKGAFQYIGVFMLIVICMYVLGFIIGGLGGVLMGAV